ncbi:uncharacterized protein LOC124496027 isoform X3 [Dermatophagoides farinae]|uniref:uncharacterized protein LOC124496027 isoform X3 n=1 Tax=Dermatophagoides farinae TaxID=6954 RepID=UPI003F5F253C
MMKFAYIQHTPIVETPPPSLEFAELQMDQPSSSSSTSSSSSSAVIVISGQKAQLICPLIDPSKMITNKKLLPSSAANTAAVIDNSNSVSSSSSVIMPIKWQKENTILPYDHRQHVQTNGTLIIQSSQKRLDEGSYYCYFIDEQQQHLLDNGNKFSQSSNNKDLIMKNGATVHLKVMDPPHVAPFEFPADLQVGMKARAMCSVMKGDQPFRFLWSQDGHRIESDLPTEDTGAIYRTQHFRDYSMLTVDSLTLSHAGNITCVVSNDAAKTSQSSLLKVNAPPQWLIEPKDTQVILHQSVKIDCLASGSPKPFTTWKRAIGSSPWEYVPIYNAVHYYLHSNGSLTIKSTTQQQSGPYICQSTNGYGSDIGKLIHLKVNEPPRFTLSTITQSAYKDKPVRLICPPEGDHPIHMEWFLLNGTHLNLDSSLDSKRDNQHRGKISLNANDNFNDKYLFEIKEISSKFLSNDERNANQNNNNNDNNNDDDELFDSIDDNLIGNFELVDQESPSSTLNHLIVSVLTIRKPTRDDSRIFQCKASNEYGWAEMKIRLIVKEKPDVPDEFSITNVTESKAEIRWHESFNGNSIIVKYVVQYRLIVHHHNDITSTESSTSINNRNHNNDDNDDQTMTTTTAIQTITMPIEKIISNGSLRQTIISDLRSNSLYQIRIAAVNRLGQSDYSKWMRFRTEQSAPESPPIDVMATPTGPNSVKITWKAPKKSEWNGEISGYYIGYRAEKSDTDLYKTIENVQMNGRHESHITNLHRSTIYKAWVQAFNTRGTGPRSEVVSVQTLADVPPSAPLLRLHSSTSDSITISWSSATYGGGSNSRTTSSSSNDLTLYYRSYQPLSSSLSSSSSTNMVDHPFAPGAKILHHSMNNNNNGQQSMIISNNWHDISILEPNGRHTVTGLECGRSYEFFATAHNSVGKSEPSTPLIARTRGEAPTPPPRNSLISETIAGGGPYGNVVVGSGGGGGSAIPAIIVNLVNWKNNECPINHFTLRIRPSPSKSQPPSSALQQQQQQHPSSSSSSTMSNPSWSILAMQHNPRENFLLRKLTPSTAYEIEITAHSSAGSTQVIHQFITPNITNGDSSFLNKIGFENSKIASIAYPPMPSSTNEISFADYEILLPVISSLIVVIVIVAVACFLCSRDHHSLFLQPIGHQRQRQPSTSSSENKVPFHHPHHHHHHHHNSNDPNDIQQQQEMSILKELVRSSSITIMDGLHHMNGGAGHQSDSSTILTTTNDGHQITNGHVIGIGLGDYDNRCIDSEPTSLINQCEQQQQQQQQQLRNNNHSHLHHHHHHQLTLMSPRHQQSKAMAKDLVELQSFLNNSTNNNNNGYIQQPQPSQKRVVGQSGNYALPYDVLPVSQPKQQSGMIIYGQRTNMAEPLYATAKLINGNGVVGGGCFNYGQKVDDIGITATVATASASSSSGSTNYSSSSRANYESLVPMICSTTTTTTSSSSSSGSATSETISTAAAASGTNTLMMITSDMALR